MSSGTRTKTVVVPVEPTVAATPEQPTPSTAPPAPRPKAATQYVFPVGGCRADASQSHHDYPASDIFADKGCLFVSPVDGRVDEVTLVDSWDKKTNVGRDRGGLSVSVVGVDGVRYYGSHLSAVGVNIRPGVMVRAGQSLGLVGKTGSAQQTPSHLHFGISWPTPAGHWWVRRGAVAPQAFLNAWHDGRQLSPVAAVAKAKRAYGADNGCRAYC
ncbi:M23 family metallopeptidase [Kribbella sp. NPDC023855]|uniref:M23 family metallopeptidase n=1 Tax=Kribbella sp. NPDC023855 TaxID=3154698 RepID=UPI0033E767DC